MLKASCAEICLENNIIKIFTVTIDMEVLELPALSHLEQGISGGGKVKCYLLIHTILLLLNQYPCVLGHFSNTTNRIFRKKHGIQDKISIALQSYIP